MANRFNTVVDPLLTPNRARGVFVAGIFLFALLGNAIYDVALSYLGSPLTIGLLAILALLLVLLANEGRKRLWRRKLVNVGLQPRRGLIVLVSWGVLRGGATKSAIEYHYRGRGDKERPTGTLQQCWLITSPEEEKEKSQSEDKPVQVPPDDPVSAWANANYLAQKYTGLIETHIVQVDPNDPIDVYEKVENALQEAQRRGLGRSDVAVNFKGGTKEMSVGMVLAATNMGYSVETTLPSEKDADGYRKSGSVSEPVLLDLRPVLQTEVE